MTTFHRAKIGSTTVASAYTAGSGSLAVVDGSQFGSTFPIVVICSRAGVRMSVLEVTARATNTLTVSGAVDGTTDVNLLVGDVVKEGPTALQTNELQDAINALPAYDRFANLVVSEVSITGAVGLTSAAFGKLHVCSGTSANYTVTLPAPAGNAGRFIGFRMSSALTKFVTIAQNGSETINGAASRMMWANETATLLCDGTNWFKLSGRSLPMVCGLVKQGAYPTIPNNAFTKILVDLVESDTTGLMADLTNSQVIIRRSGNYQLLVSPAWGGFSAASTQVLAAPFLNGSIQLTGGGTPTISGGAPTYNFSQEAGLTAGATIDVRLYQISGASQTGISRILVRELDPW